jgi:hypothetical protein
MALLQISEPGQSPNPHERRIAVGIDLGTTHSLVAAVRNGVAECLPDAAGAVLLPSVVRYLDAQRRQIGQEALQQQSADPGNTIASVKRLMGRGLADGIEQGGGRRAVPTPWRSFVRAFGLARLSRRWPKLFNDFHLHRQPLPPGPIPVEAISGACMLLKREAIDDFGLMDEGYFLHCEDLDLCMRARAHGWQILFVPDAPIVHHKGGCSRERPVFVEWHKHRGMVRFYRKHFRHEYSILLMELVTLGVWLRFAAVAARQQASVLWHHVRAPRTPAVRATSPAVGSMPLDHAVMPLVVSNRPLVS